MAVIGLSRLRSLVCTLERYEERLKDVDFLPYRRRLTRTFLLLLGLSPLPLIIFLSCFFVLRCPSVVSVTSIRFVIGICVVLVIAVVVITVESR